MKIKRFENILNESAVPKEMLSDWSKRSNNIIKAYNDECGRIKNEMLVFLNGMLAENEKIDFTEDGYNENATYAFINDDDIIKIRKYKNEIFVITNDNKFTFNTLTLQTANDLMYIIERLYVYQKEIIENDPERISKILPYLHPVLKKEYPHLTTGKDFNLL